MKQIPHILYRTNEGKLQVTQTWSYSLCDNFVGFTKDKLFIKAGFKTNGASIPKMFWWLLNPFNPTYLEECTIHDALCQLKQYKRADKWLNVLLIQNTEVKKWQQILIICGVKFWHCLGYQQAAYYGKASDRYWLKVYKKFKRYL